MAAATRIGDADVPHCSSMVRAQGSPNVRVNGRGWSRVGDLNSSHLVPGGVECAGHAAAITQGSSSVRINGRAAGRVGDPIAGCTAVAEGSPDVFCGG
ncbi:MAG: hypothetical protein ERJ68_00100 [Aphanocapsa feldmannii 277cI]|uniref:PAAR domain-containing protein n=1 Tax=Aphanocapsa feldmannii 277cI TaxID=2507554 RepID=A0A524RW02_9CHRO|nr:MAG: hypothetical protein ERJ68_00100 [Aphanocapsa feldmannii 277cI]